MWIIGINKRKNLNLNNSAIALIQNKQKNKMIVNYAPNYLIILILNLLLIPLLAKKNVQTQYKIKKKYNKQRTMKKNNKMKIIPFINKKQCQKKFYSIKKKEVCDFC